MRVTLRVFDSWDAAQCCLAGFQLRPVKVTVTSGTHEGASYAIRLLGCSAMLCTVGATHEGASRRTATPLEARGPAGFRLRPVKMTVTSGTHEGASYATRVR